VAKHKPLAEPAAALVEIRTLTCIECHRPWLDSAERWRLKVLDDDVPETVPYCPDCAYREFGPSL
jgi:RNase P subunit RPR2